jgi:hypothetical protein
MLQVSESRKLTSETWVVGDGAWGFVQLRATSWDRERPPSLTKDGPHHGVPELIHLELVTTPHQCSYIRFVRQPIAAKNVILLDFDPPKRRAWCLCFFTLAI